MFAMACHGVVRGLRRKANCNISSRCSEAFRAEPPPGLGNRMTEVAKLSITISRAVYAP